MGRRSEDDVRQINRSKKFVIEFKGKLFKMIKDDGVNLMIIQSRLELGIYYCIEIMN